MPPNGTYVIYNRVLSPTGEKLAITFGGADKAVTVSPLSGSPLQRWRVSSFEATTFRIATLDDTLEIGWGDKGPIPMTPHLYVWAVQEGPSGTTIQNGGQTVNWHLDEAIDNFVVSIDAYQKVERYNWIFEAVN